MNKKHSLELTSSTGAVKDLCDDFDFVVIEMPFVTRGELKEIAKTEYPDEDGEDVYVPKVRHYKPGSADIKIGYKGRIGTSFIALSNLESWLASAGLMGFYSEWSKAGFAECSYTGSYDAKLTTMCSSEVLEATIRFAIHNPTNIIEK